MKATQKDFAGLAARAAREARVFYFCGPDEAGAQEAAATILGLLEPGAERVELAGADLRRDPVRLGDEARSTSLFGESRYIYVRASGDEVAEAVEILLSGEAEPCPVLIVATGATDKSKTAKLLAPRKDALVAMFWPPDLKSVAATVRTIADQKGVRVDGALAERIARAAGLDLRIARSEIDKIALYLDAAPEAPRTAAPSVFEAIGATTEEEGFMPIVNAVLNGDGSRVPAELARMKELSINPVGMLLAMERRVAQLAVLAGKLGASTDIRGLLEAEKSARRVFWRDETDLAIQLRKWRGRRLERLVDKVIALHRALLANSQSAELLLAQGLAEIARASSSKN